MEFYVNGTKIDVELENEKTIGDVLRGFEEECAKSGRNVLKARRAKGRKKLSA